jgi:hypothetical protein
MVETASYVIFGEDLDGDGVSDVIYAKNGLTGEIEFQSNNASYVIQSAIDNLINGGKIFIKAGVYIMTTPILIDEKHWLTIQGEGYLTVLKATDGLNDDVIKTSPDKGPSWYVTLTNFKIDGNKEKNTKGNGMNISLRRSVIFNIYIKDVKEDGINLWGLPGTSPQGNRISHCLIENADGNGIHFSPPASDNHVISCVISHSGNAAVLLQTGTNQIFDNHFTSSGRYVIYIDGKSNNLIEENIFDGIQDGGNYAIFLDASNGPVKLNVINGNFFFNLKSGQNAIRLKRIGAPGVSYNVISGNTFNGENVCEVAIYFEGVAGYKPNYNIIFGNTFLNFVGDVIDTTNEGIGNIIRNNQGFATENSGTVVIPEGFTSVTVNHGLVSTPSIVTVTPNKDTRFWITNKNTNNFTINIPSSVVEGVSFDWYAEV